MENIFQEIKEKITAREIAEGYGLKVSRNGMALCPFHDDRNPSMKIDERFYCFACGVMGDGVGYAASLFGLSQYDAAKKVIEDFSLPIEFPSKLSAKEKRIVKRKADKRIKEKARIVRLYERFDRWCEVRKEELHACVGVIESIKDKAKELSEDELFSFREFTLCIMAEPLINYWLDILYMGSKDEKALLYLENRKEVEEYVKEVSSYDRRDTKGARGDSEHESRNGGGSDRRAG